MKLFCDAVQTDETRRRSVHQRVQQTPRTAISAEVPGVSDRKAGQVGGVPTRRVQMAEFLFFNREGKGFSSLFIDIFSIA